MKAPFWAATVTAAMLLGGCATPRTGTPASTAGTSDRQAAWLSRVQHLRSVDQFVLNGRFSSSSLAARGDLRWRQFPDGRFELRLAGPFGAGALELRGNGDEVEVRSKDGVFRTTDPEGWLRQHYGWSLPIAGLRYWALGVPAPGTAVVVDFDGVGRASRLQQSGWTIAYTEYLGPEVLDLPRRFDASNDQINLRVLIDRWEPIPRS